MWFDAAHMIPFSQSHGSVLKALEDDPTVFEYDSLYDDMQEKKKRADPRLVKKDKSVC